MTKKNKAVFGLFLGLLLLMFACSLSYFSGFFGNQPAYAGASDNVSGYGWSDHFGWVSFNSTNRTGEPDYGVNLDVSTGNLSGYAWSDNFGWLSFERSTAGNPPSNDPGSGSGPIARYEAASGNKVIGWANVLALGNDGWLRFDHGRPNEATIDPSTGQFHGWAWNGNNDADHAVGIGWLSLDGASGGGNVVVTGLNQNPTLSNLSSANQSFSQACALGALGATLQWTYSDPDSDPQTSYRIVLDNNSDLGSPIINTTIAGAATQYSVPAGNLAYNSTYYWGVQVWDSRGGYSSLIAGPAFTTYLHEFPEVDFHYTPDAPSKGQEVQLVSDSRYFATTNPTTPVSCSGGSCSYVWSFASECQHEIVSGTVNSDSLVVKFNNAAACVVTLQVTDANGYNCAGSQSIDVKQALPTWKESR